MFGETKTLIVVSKDEMAINQLKKLVESDKERYPAVKIVAWNEKIWNANKKSGNIDSKVLFIGDVKGTDKLVPVIDEKFSEHGVKFGWAGKQAIIVSEVKSINAQDEYNAFFEVLETLPIPDMLKKRVTQAKEIEELEDELDNSDDSDDSDVDSLEVTDEVPVTDEVKKDKLSIFKKIGAAVKVGAEKVGNLAEGAKDEVASTAQEVFKDRNLMKRQQLFYGVIKMCEDGLQEFINS